MARTGLFSIIALSILQKDFKRMAGLCRAVLGQAIDVPHDPVRDPTWQVRADFVKWVDLMMQVRGHDLRSGVTTEGMEPRQGVVVDTADGIHVGPSIEFDAFELFWSHEKDRAKHGIRLVGRLQRRFRRVLSEAEIDNFHLEFS